MFEFMTLLSILAKLFGVAGEPHRQTALTESCPAGIEATDGAFSDAVTALGAKLARAEGPSRPGEFDRFTEIFRPQPAAEADVRRLYRLARQTTLGFEGYARKLSRRYGHCPVILERVLDGLFQLALADGIVSERETEYLERVADALGVTPAVYRAVRARRLGLGEDDPYRVLEVDPAAPDEVVRAAWKKLLVETHPDRAVARGLPRELVERAQIKAQAINAAFDRVMHERRSGFAAGAA
jgi:DnaJ like chaperone protein